MNEHQKHNAELWATLSDATKADTINGNWSHIGYQRFIRCVDCGREGSIGLPILRFYRFEITAVRCYDCQQKTRRATPLTKEQVQLLRVERTKLEIEQVACVEHRLTIAAEIVGREIRRINRQLDAAIPDPYRNEYETKN